MNDLKQPLANNLISVDCVIFGYDGEQLKVLLANRLAHNGDDEVRDKKLPGDIIFLNEDLNLASARILHELTGLKGIDMCQFRAYGSKDRTNKRVDVEWLAQQHNLNTDEIVIVTVAYLAVVKLDRNINAKTAANDAEWVSVGEIASNNALAFDHNTIIQDALTELRNMVETEPAFIFDLIPTKFTAAQLRHIYECIYGKEFDVRNFQKKINAMTYVTPLEEKEQNVSHRAARYYRFDKVIYRNR